MDSKAIRKLNMRVLISRAGGVKQFAERVGTNPDYVSSLLSEKGNRKIGDQLARRSENAFTLPEGWMDVVHPEEANIENHPEWGSFGSPADSEEQEPVQTEFTKTAQLEPSKKYGSESDTYKIAQEFVLVPRYDVESSMGQGRVINSEQIVDHLAFKKNWVHYELGANERNLALITAIGDSMEPTLRPGDLILIDTSVRSIKGDAIYVISLDGELLAKRMQRLMNGSVIIKSDNPAYIAQQLEPAELDRLAIVGRVVWSGRRM